MNELERTAINEILRTVTYIAEKMDKLEEQLSPHLTETDKKEVMALISDRCSNHTHHPASYLFCGLTRL